MAAKSFHLPRLSFSRGGDAPILPFHNSSSPPIHRKTSEYDMSDLSPRPEESLLSPSPPRNHKAYTPGRRSSSPPSAPYSDNASSTAGSASKSKPRVLFAGPPPPIATSRMLYRDEEGESGHHHHQPRTSRALNASSFARNINSVLFDRGSPTRTRDQRQDYEPDAIWRNLQHREHALQKELQRLLDAQSAGLAAHLDPNAAANTPPAPSSTGSSSSRAHSIASFSDAGSSTPTGTLHTTSTSTRRSQFGLGQPTRATARGEIIPVRQPRQKPLGLRAARTALARNISLLADLKAEEDASLASALSVRKKALAQLRKLAARREEIADKMQVLESDEEDELARELRLLGEEREGVVAEMAELEERLVGLRNRRRWLDGRLEDVRNSREAGLSGYKGALKEVEGRVQGILRRPPVKPLDIEAIAGPAGGGVSASASASGGSEVGREVEQSPGGAEFLRMRPERRTVDMAREWWEGEVAILERRKEEVDAERVALEEGVEVWKSAVKLVSDFEAGLRKEMSGETGDDGGGKGKVPVVTPTPEQAMNAQLDKMVVVMAGLDELLHIAEDKGWNLLICAIGAELEAFKEAGSMLRDTLRAAGLGDHEDGSDDDDKETTIGLSARLAASMRGSAFKSLDQPGADLRDERTRGSVANLRSSVFKSHGDRRNSNNDLVNLRDDDAHDSDNEVPADLLGAVPPPEELRSPVLSRDDSLGSENEVPPEFLAEHHGDDVE
ncbi:hypothetical protein B0T19DRAFT_295863 [Cercophora scortea]|uniref:Autophagy-related protein 28 n=1 Tax=Cercophora scortea TaxID=314031 RepID=A0AAE0I316_9PEZI|nr:hypothetical protein B0T19DRAFT_295863 [Cercophora scortea]